MVYPDLSPNQALLQYYRDIYEAVPEPIRSQLPEIGMSIGNLRNYKGFVFVCQMVRMFGWRNAGTREAALADIPNLMRQQTELLQNIQNQLRAFQRQAVFGQLAAFSISAAAVAQIKRLADQAERAAGSLRGIESLLESEHIRGQHFPRHVHSYIRLMMERFTMDNVPHYFTVFNHGDLWYPDFADIQRGDPLGPFYLGQRTDLDELCAFLAEEVRPQVGPGAILHVLMPSVGPLSLEEAITFPEAMRPFSIDGQTGNGGTRMVYMCVPERRDQECLHGVGVLRQREIWRLLGTIGIPPLGTSFCQYFVDPAYRVRTEAGLLLGGGFYGFYCLEPPRVLGQPAERPWA